MDFERQPSYRRSQLEVSHTRIANGRVLRVTQDAAFGRKPQIVSLEVAESAGATPVELGVQLESGTVFNLLGNSNAETIQTRFEARLKAQDPYASNVFFQPGAAGVLFGLANRLSGEKVGNETIEAQILGHKVRAPLNHGLGAGETPHHLHGFGYDKPTTMSGFQDSRGVHLKAEFEPGFHLPYWSGLSKMTLHHSLENGAYIFKMEVENVGETPIPMGAGAHPYFRAPSGDPAAVRLRIPGRKLVEIDNYKNVLPTGKILPISADSEFNFQHPKGRSLRGQYLDNLWVDLELDGNGYAFTEFIDEKAKLRVRMTALTKNIIGIQAYAPRPQDKPELGVFAALEFVTNLPDPRDDLWGSTPTGMVLLNPGEKFRYGYRIDTIADH